MPRRPQRTTLPVKNASSAIRPIAPLAGVRHGYGG
jgi:hypothetical protein